MSIGIHPVHRRLVELYLASMKRPLAADEEIEKMQCLRLNADIIRELDELTQIKQLACKTGDTKWYFELCGRIEKLQSGMDVF